MQAKAGDAEGATRTDRNWPEARTPKKRQPGRRGRKETSGACSRRTVKDRARGRNYVEDRKRQLKAESRVGGDTDHETATGELNKAMRRDEENARDGGRGRKNRTDGTHKRGEAVQRLFHRAAGAACGGRLRRTGRGVKVEAPEICHVR